MKCINTRAFTLVELMITITIMGLLAGTAAIHYQKAMETSRITTAKEQLQAIVFAIEQYERNEGKPFWKVRNLSKLKKYLSRKKLTDPWGHKFYVDGTFVYSAGPDGVVGGRYSSDDIRMRYRRDPLINNPTFRSRNRGVTREAVGWIFNPPYQEGAELQDRDVVYVDPFIAYQQPNSLCVK